MVAECKDMRTWVVWLGLPALMIFATSSASADADEDLRAKTQNPVGSLISVPFENNVDFGAPNGTAYVLNFQPVVPVTVGTWNLINRPILPIAYVPGFIGGVPGLPSGSEGDGAFGLGDLNYSLFVSPAEACWEFLRQMRWPDGRCSAKRSKNSGCTMMLGTPPM